MAAAKTAGPKHRERQETHTPRGGHGALALFLGLGLAITMAATLGAHMQFQKEWRAAFDAAARLRFSLVKSGVIGGFQHFQQAVHLIQAHPGMERTAFAHHARAAIVNAPGLQAFAWLELERPASRVGTSLLGARFLEIADGFSENQTEALLARPEFAQTAAQALENGRVTLSQPLGGGGGEVSWMLAATPLSWNKASATGGEEKIPIAAAIFRLDGLVEQTISQIAPGGVDFLLQDITDPAAPWLLHFHHSRRGPSGPGNQAELLLRELPGPRHQAQWPLHGRIWRFIAAPSRHFPRGWLQSWGHLPVLVGGLLLTLSTALHLHRLRQNLTEKEALSEALAQSQEGLIRAQRIANIGNWDWNIAEGALVWSAQTHTIFGLSEQQFTGSYQDFLTIVHPDDRIQVDQQVRRILADPAAVYDVVHRVVRPDGAVRTVHERGEVIRNDQQKPERLVGTVHDITEQREAAQKEARVNEARMAISAMLRAALEPTSLTEQLQTALDILLAVPWLSMEPRGAIFLMDEESGELMLAVHRDLSAPIQAACARIPLGYCLCGRAALDKETIFAPDLDQRHEIRYPGISPHGHYCAPILFQGAIRGVINLYLPQGRQPDADGEEIAFLNAFADALAGLLERRRVEEALLEAKEAAESANQAKSTFLANVSHEIRTPMNAILGMSEMLSETPLNADQKELVRVLQGAGENLLRVINDILDLSKVEAGKLEITRVSFSLREIVADAVMILAAPARSKGLALNTQIDSNLPDRILGDANRIRQILINLISNAVKFTDAGSVTVAVGEKVRTERAILLHFQVVDTGVGIPVGKRESLFSAFVQAAAPRTNPREGAGLGLAICQNLLELMGGDIWFDSEEDRGSVFHFILPLFWEPPLKAFISEPVADANANAAPPPGALPGWGGDRKEPFTVLLADDTPDNSFLVRAFLRGAPITLEVVENGRDAVARFQEKRFDLVLMDIQMPVMDGLTATREIRAWEAENGRSHTPVLAISAFAMREDQQKALDAGCDRSLTKPIRKERLLQAIGESLLRFRPDAPPGQGPATPGTTA